MALGFPLYIDLNGNNCVVFGGGDYAASCAKTLLAFGAKVTVICPVLSERMRELAAQSEAGWRAGFCNPFCTTCPTLCWAL